MRFSERSAFALAAGSLRRVKGKPDVRRAPTRKTPGSVRKGERAVDKSSYEKMTHQKLVETVCFLKEQNQKLGATLLWAMRDMAKLDACEICTYNRNGSCTAPKELTMGGSCFCWRGKGEK